MNTISKTRYGLFLTYVFVFLFVNLNVVYGQEKKVKDSSNFVFYPDKIMIRTNLSTQLDSYVLQNKTDTDLFLETNTNYKLFLSVDYKFIGFSYGFYPHFFGGNNDESTKGKSSYSDYNFRFFLGKWLQTVQYSKTRGYYVKNTIDFNPDWTVGKDPYILIPNLKTQQYGMSTSYIFNPKFSLKSIYSFTEWQKESAGSFIPTLVYDYNQLSYDLEGTKDVQKEYNVRIATSYFYNFIIHKRFYISPNLSPSIGVKFVNSKSTQADIQQTENDTYFTKYLEGGLKIGYNTERILFGASFNFNESWYNESKTAVVSNSKVYGFLYFGYRFDAPNFIQKPVDVINDKLKL
ncbi:DUF4421 family protein [Flavobacterium alvei]|uniref:DUF4421 family protein n=1 Tax=Flavobacterium alvei TaxID=2080416 RepID=UPI0026F185C9|nr:DUF4421 family protein [Flavobacterium alvei]